jgi:hypothetical protein
MTERDPERLLKAAPHGLARELLRVAREDVAPLAVRERVLSDIAMAVERARAEARVPINTLSGVFERRGEGAGVEGEAGGTGGEACAMRRASSRIGGAVARTSAWQLAAAVVAGVVLAKGLHWAAEVSSAAVTGAHGAIAAAMPAAPHSVTVPRQESASAISATVAATRASPATEPVPAASASSGWPEAVLPEPVLPEVLSLEAFVPNIGARGAARNVSSRTTVHATYDVGAVSPAEHGDDDWLGAQLVLLSQAERSLLAGDPGGALRSLDEYRARFPRGLLDPQIATLRERAQRSIESFIFP